MTLEIFEEDNRTALQSMIDPVMNKINYETENTAEKVVNSLMYRVHQNFFQLFLQACSWKIITLVEINCQLAVSDFSCFVCSNNN